MNEPIAVVGVSAIMPDGPDATTFWANILSGRYCISDVPPGRWDPDLYYDPDPQAPYKTYSRIGGWVREFPWDPIGWRLPVPPTVATQMDIGQQWAVAGARAALLDAGWPEWEVDPERVAVILGNAIGGEKHYWSSLHIEYPQFVQALRSTPSFAAMPDGIGEALLAEARAAFFADFPGITEDTMPGELANVVAGRVANLFNFRGPNFTTDAACASGLAAVSVAVRALQARDVDAAVTGGVDRNMGADAFVKFCKIGALSATGTRPFDAGADGFVMGEGAAQFVLKRLSDAERSGDRIYAVLLGQAGSSDGRGKGITAPNPVGQRLAIERAWADANIDPALATYVEAHGTSTRVGDATELASLTEVFAKAGAGPGTIALGSVKSNVGHLKAAAGAAGLLKMVLSLHERVLPPTLSVVTPNPQVAWAETPFRLNTELSEWPAPPKGAARSGGVSAFGFGGTNFHLVLEEHVPGRYRAENAPRSFASAQIPAVRVPVPPTRHAVVVGGSDDADVADQLDALATEARAGRVPGPVRQDPELAGAAVRVAIDYGTAAELADKASKAAGALRAANPAVLRMLRAQGVHVGRGPAPKVAFLYTGQGSQYVNMLRDLREREPIVADAFAEADQIMTPLLGRPLSEYIFVDPADLADAEQRLLQTEITQPAVLTADLALTEVLGVRGIHPDMVMGHSLGEYGALVAAGALSFEAALEAVSARGREMAHLSIEDNGAMAAVFGQLSEVERVLSTVDGYVVIANINSTGQAVIGGATSAVAAAIEALQAAGLTARRLPVSHAFHTSIVAPVSVPLTDALRRLDIRPPRLPIVSNVTGQFYPDGADVATVLDLLGRQVAAPVQFVAGLHTLYAAGARVFVEVGPKRALHGFVEDVLGGYDDVVALFTNYPKLGDEVALNQALCGLYAAGLGLGPVTAEAPSPVRTDMTNDRYSQLGRLFADALEQGLRIYQGTPAPAPAPVPATAPARPGADEPVVITGAALGLPGVPRVFDDANLARILAGQQFIDTIPHRFRREMVDHRITRLVKRESGDPTFEAIDREADVIKLAGRHAPLDVVAEFGVDAARDEALDVTTRLAIGAGIDALRDAGIPLVMRYRTTTLGTRIPDRWGLPESMQDDTGVVFASAFPGYDAFAQDLQRYAEDRGRREQLLALEAVRARMRGDEPAVSEVDRRIGELRRTLAAEPYTFDRRFLFRALSMGHSQFAELIGARGPNTQVNAACASTTQAIGLAEDWIRAGRCRRVIIVAADDVTSDNLLPWVGSGFLASGAAATDDVVEDAAMPFDRRRHGMIVGMGAAALVVESAGAARERAIQPICEVLGAVTANSAYHGTRLDVDHIGQVMEDLLRQAEARGVDRKRIAGETVFLSHETYTPARGGSAAAEINALRRVFGTGADDVVIANTKGFTGHAMGAGVEDVVAVKALETGIVPPVPNFKEPDPELGTLQLSTGGAYPVRYALRLAAGFGSQIAMALLRWTPPADGRRRGPDELGYGYRIVDAAAWQRWLDEVSGRPGARLEVVQHQLRVIDATAPVVVQPEPAAVVEIPVVSTVEPVSPPATVDDVQDAVVGIVAELTGYPPELLDVDLDLEADLGVDTVKQAEVFAAVRQRFEVPRDESLSLRDFPTLSHVINWVRDKTVVPAVVPVAVPAVPVESTEDTPGQDDVEKAVVDIVAGLTGYPPELLDVDLDLEADLGVDTVKQAEVFAAVRQRFEVPRDESLSLRDFPTLSHVINWVRDKTPTESAPAESIVEQPASTEDEIVRRVPVTVVRPSLSQCVPTGVTLGAGTRVAIAPDSGGVAKALTKRLKKLGVEVTTIAGIGDRPVDGVYWLTALDDEGPIDQLDLTGWREALHRRVGALYSTVRRLYEQSPFLVTGTRLGGYHGYDPAGATSPLGGAVTGFAKAYRKERPDALVKAVDTASTEDAVALADLLIEETLRDPGCVEVGYADGLRWGVALAERPFGPAGTTGIELTKNTTFVVTGAAGGIVSAITADLAAASGGTFHLLDLTPEPNPGDDDLRRFTEDRDGLARDIAVRLRERGERPTPVLVERELARYERGRAALDAIRAVEAAGGTAYYHSVDLTDSNAVEKVLAEVRATTDRIDVLLHAAGIEVSHALPDKEEREFGLVLGVKADGWFNLLHGTGDLPIGAVVAFSSVAGRFGNAGQTDYSAANDLLCKLTSELRRSRPGTRAIALDWTAWGGIGMATRGSIPKIMAAAGVQLLPPETGIPWVRRELTAGTGSGEVVVAGALGAMATEWHSPVQSTDAPLVGEVEFGVHTGLTVRTTLDPKTVPFLDDHRIDGTPVLPGVMGIEAFAEAARLLVPDWHVVSVEDVDFQAPVKFYRDEPRTVTITALLQPAGTDLVADCALSAERLLAGQNTPQRTVHFTGRVRLSREAPTAEPGEVVEAIGAPLEPKDVYRLYFHGPAYQVVGSARRQGEGAAATFAAGLPAQVDGVTITGPRLIELCFQTAGLWEAGTEGRLALPAHVDRVQVLGEPVEGDGVTAEVHRSAYGFDAVVRDHAGRPVLRLEGYRTTPLPQPLAADVLDPIRAAMSR